jgi:hypothetical protein
MINEQHRKGCLEPEMAKWTTAIISHMDSLSPCPGWVFQGMDVSSCFTEVDVERLFCIPGRIYTDKAFMSTSWKDSVAWDFATPNDPKPMGSVILIIKHHSGKFIRQFVTEEYKQEEEVLITPGTQFRSARIVATTLFPGWKNFELEEPTRRRCTESKVARSLVGNIKS